MRARGRRRRTRIVGTFPRRRRCRVGRRCWCGRDRVGRDAVGILDHGHREQPEREHGDRGCGHQHPSPTRMALAGQIIERRRVRVAPIDVTELLAVEGLEHRARAAAVVGCGCLGRPLEQHQLVGLRGRRLLLAEVSSVGDDSAEDRHVRDRVCRTHHLFDLFEAHTCADPVVSEVESDNGARRRASAPAARRTGESVGPQQSWSCPSSRRSPIAAAPPTPTASRSLDRPASTAGSPRRPVDRGHPARQPLPRPPRRPHRAREASHQGASVAATSETGWRAPLGDAVQVRQCVGLSGQVVEASPRHQKRLRTGIGRVGPVRAAHAIGQHVKPVSFVHVGEASSPICARSVSHRSLHVRLTPNVDKHSRRRRGARPFDAELLDASSGLATETEGHQLERAQGEGDDPVAHLEAVGGLLEQVAP